MHEAQQVHHQLVSQHQRYGEPERVVKQLPLGSPREGLVVGGRDAIERGDVVSQLAARTGHANIAWLAIHRIDDARAQLAAAEASLPPGFHLPHVLAMIAACNIELYAGNAAAAAERNPADPSSWGKVGRNESCPCGSGKKYKHCHGRFA